MKNENNLYEILAYEIFKCLYNVTFVSIPVVYHVKP